MNAAIEDAWNAVLQDWEDDAAHKRFVALCVAHGQLHIAGGQYRGVRDEDTANQADAERRMEALTALAMQQMEMNHEAVPVEKYRRTLVLLAAAVMLGLMAVGVLLFRAAN